MQDQRTRTRRLIRAPVHESGICGCANEPRPLYSNDSDRHSSAACRHGPPSISLQSVIRTLTRSNEDACQSSALAPQVTRTHVSQASQLRPSVRMTLCVCALSTLMLLYSRGILVVQQGTFLCLLHGASVFSVTVSERSACHSTPRGSWCWKPFAYWYYGISGHTQAFQDLFFTSMLWFSF